MTEQHPPQHAVPPCTHEVMRQFVSGLDRAIAETVRQARSSSTWAEGQTIEPSSLIELKPIQEMLDAYGWEQLERGATREEAVEAANFLGNYTFPLLNFELHRRKLFWVETSLAFMLSQTRLDIEGSALKVPFPSLAFVFTDEATLGVVRALIARDEDPSVAARTPRVLTVYVTRVKAPGDAMGLNLSFFMDGRDGRWPYLVGRDLFVRPGDKLDAILDSHFPESTTHQRDPIFSSPELGRLVHLVVNALLYSTSLPLPLPVRESPLRKVQRSAKGRGDKKRARVAHRLDDLRKEHSADDVFFLPGRISISQVRRLQELERGEEGRGLLARFMVRGHWRHANPDWEDQRLRWIEPYWKGPEMAALIEREYELEP